jgi:hypothetical protein
MWNFVVPKHSGIEAHRRVLGNVGVGCQQAVATG